MQAGTLGPCVRPAGLAAPMLAPTYHRTYPTAAWRGIRPSSRWPHALLIGRSRQHIISHAADIAASPRSFEHQSQGATPVAHFTMEALPFLFPVLLLPVAVNAYRQVRFWITVT